MSQSQQSHQATCCICGGPADKVVMLGPKRIHFCEYDYTIAKQGVRNLANIREILHQNGIHIGIPRGG